jgi:chorismate lyase/3-hydroxybenzoate synthase
LVPPSLAQTRVDPHAAPAPLAFAYEDAPAAALLAQDDVLAVFEFGSGEASARDPRLLRIALDPVGPARREVWRGHGRIRAGTDGAVRHAGDDDYRFVAVELDEDAHGGVEAAAEIAYRELTGFVAASPTPHLLRLWNYLDAINLGSGDDERYRRFCSGRARGMRELASERYPAATAIGVRDGRRRLQVFGLAGREPARFVENPRQTSAWRYPRQYGPAAPAFARAARTAAGALLISGTAAVIGHASHHAGDTLAQLDETHANLDALLAAAGHAPARAGLYKIYLRSARDADAVRARAAAIIGDSADLLVLEGDICRRELMIEIEGIRP